MIKTIHIKLLLLFSLSFLFGHSVFAQSAPTPPVEQHVCVGVSVDYYFYGFPGSTVHWDFNEPVSYTPSGNVVLNNASNNITFDGVLYQKGVFPHVYATQGDYLLSIVEQTLSCSSNEITLPVHVHAKPVISNVDHTDIVCSGDVGSVTVDVTATVPDPLQLQYRLVTSLDVEVVAWTNDDNLSHDFNNLLAGSYKAQIRYVLDSDNSIIVKGSLSESSVVVIDSGDTVDPTASNPVAVNVQCSGDVPSVDITVVTDEADNCTVLPIVTFISDSDNGGLGTTASPYVVTRTYSVADEAGNSINVYQTIIAIDNQPPVTPTLATVTEECSATVTAPTTTDACSGTITGTTSDPLTYNTQGTYAITWNFDDGNGNAIDVVQTVIIDDTTNPVISSCPSAIVECAVNEITQEAIVSNINLAAINYSDNCGGPLTVQYQIKKEDDSILVDFGDDSDGDASDYSFPVGINTVTYRVIDVAGLSSECSFTVTITHKPILSEIE